MGQYQKREQQQPRVTSQPLHVQLEIEPRELERMIREGLQGLALEIGLEVAHSLLLDEVERHCGPKGRRGAERTAYRYGRQPGSIRVGGQKVSLQKPRVRLVKGGEVALETYHRFQQEANEDSVRERLVRGVSCRNYRAVVLEVLKGRGISASAVSRSFVNASAARLEELTSRRFDGVRFVAIYLDGVVFARETVVAAIGVTEHGDKRVLALRHGATENAQVCVDLLSELRERGISTETRMLFVIDGSKALRVAIDRVWGANALVQRCRVHKLRNLKGYVPDAHWPEARTRVQKAWNETSYAKAKRSLEMTVQWLEWINPHAAASLRDGLEETLTVVALGLRGPLARTFASTNLVESVFSRTRTMTARVKRWRSGAMRQRWCATALLHAEQSFHRVQGRADIPSMLLPKLDASPVVAQQYA